MFGNISLTSTNILLTGGAAGADTMFAKCAAQAKHQVVHWVFSGFKTKLRSNLYELTDELLTEADSFVLRANKGLNRTFPTKNSYTNNLIRRNYYQVKWCSSVYAVSKFDSGGSMLNVDGGTAWAMQMYADRFMYDQEPFELCNLYLYDQNYKCWYHWNKVWTSIDSPPTPQGVYAGIGSREINNDGIAAIQALYSKDAKA